MRWTDDHCHLGWGEDDRLDPAAADALVADAVAAGVERMVSVGTDATRSADAIAAARRYPGRVWATVGVHPHEARHGLDGLADLLAAPEVVAVGETGGPAVWVSRRQPASAATATPRQRRERRFIGGRASG